MKIVAAIIIAASMFLGACGGTEIRYDVHYVGDSPITDADWDKINTDLKTCPQC